MPTRRCKRMPTTCSTFGTSGCSRQHVRKRLEHPPVWIPPSNGGPAARRAPGEPANECYGSCASTTYSACASDDLFAPRTRGTRREFSKASEDLSRSDLSLRRLSTSSSSRCDHCFDESSTGYSLAGYTPTEPVSTSPVICSFLLHSAAVHSAAANGNLSLFLLSQPGGTD
jgi:hypothetical protein